MPRPRRSLNLELLERRDAPATFGIPWPDADDLTLSFVPDGTPIDGRPSELFRTLDARLPTLTWQREILRAFQTWAETAHLNGSVVTETPADGSADGFARFGKIRVAAVPLSPSTVALATPFDPTAGKYAGDVWLNSNYAFGIGDGA